MTGEMGRSNWRLWVVAVISFVALGFVDSLTPGFAGDDSLWAVVRLWAESGTSRAGYGAWEAVAPVAVLGCARDRYPGGVGRMGGAAVGRAGRTRGSVARRTHRCT